jgi:hypothetical protein
MKMVFVGSTQDEVALLHRFGVTFATPAKKDKMKENQSNVRNFEILQKL